MLTHTIETFDFNQRLIVVHPITARPGELSVGPFTTLEPLLVTKGSSGQWMLDLDMRRVLKIPTSALVKNREGAKALCHLLGPQFAKRWNYANMLVFERPLIALVGTRVFRTMVMRFGKRNRFDIPAWRWLWKHRETLLPILQRDNAVQYAPLLRACNFNSQEHPLRWAREYFGKLLWRRLTQQSPNRLFLIAGAIGARTHHNGLRVEPALVEQFASLPTTFLQQPMFQAARQSRWVLHELETLNHLAQRHDTPYNVFQPYRRALEQRDLLIRHRPTVPTNWSARRLQEEYDDLQRELRELRERIAERAALTEAERKERTKLYREQLAVPFEPVPYAPLQLEDAVMLTSRLAYIERGTAHRHCLGGYADAGARGEVITYAIGGADGTTAMINHQGAFLQHYGKCNTPVTEDHHIGLMERLCMEIRRGYLNAQQAEQPAGAA